MGNMKKLIYLLPISLFLTVFFYSCSPKTYSTAADTVNLNKEYRVLLRDVVNLRGDINKLRSKIPVLEAKAQKAEAKSRASLEESRRQASTATSGNLKQIRKAESKADDAQDDAEDAKDANQDLEEAQKSLSNAQRDLAQKENRLKDLDQQRQTIQGT
jgi:DNA repair exonuclease SbcCD ATPase subunit